MIPISILIFLPKKWQDKIIKKAWDKKTDQQIIDSYNDCSDWISSVCWLKGKSSDKAGIAIFDTMIDESKTKLKEYVLPQMEKRKLTPNKGSEEWQQYKKLRTT